MISGFARGGQILEDCSLTERAIDAAEYIYNHMYDKETHTLHRSSYVEEGKPTSR